MYFARLRLILQPGANPLIILVMTKRDIFTAFFGLLATFAVALVFGWLLGWFGAFACLVCSFAGLAELGND